MMRNLMRKNIIKINSKEEGFYIEGILIENNFTVTCGSDLITESQTSLNMSKLRRSQQNQTNERGFGALSNTDDSEMQNQEDGNIIIEYGLDSHCSNMTENFGESFNLDLT